MAVGTPAAATGAPARTGAVTDSPSTASRLRLDAVLGAIRYRFFLFAGLLPYLLGAAWARGIEGSFKPGMFWLGLLGILCSVAGVEAFNEYYDSRLGTDRVFNPSDEDPIPGWVLTLGLAAFAAAAACGLLLAWFAGPPVLVYMALGGLAAAFYVGPPIRWAYRGLGELMIGLSYGPWMVLGSAALHSAAFTWGGLAASLVPGLLVAALAVANEVPDFHQDRLVGKRNLVVRLGRGRGVVLYAALGAAGLAIPAAGAAAGVFPPLAALATLAGAPLWWRSAASAMGTFESPRSFVPAVRSAVLCYCAAVAALTLAILAGRP